jgi:superoxide dismutase
MSRSYLEIYENVDIKDDKPYRTAIPIALDSTRPAMSFHTNRIHYEVLHENYVKKWEEKPSDFTWYGAMLHNLWWLNLQPYEKTLRMTGPAEEMIKGMFSNHNAMMEAMNKAAAALHGNGWLLITDKGQLKTIPNHEAENVYDHIVLLIDLWEHALVDHEFQRDRYLPEIIRCINWDVVSERLVR